MNRIPVERLPVRSVRVGVRRSAACPHPGEECHQAHVSRATRALGFLLTLLPALAHGEGFHTPAVTAEELAGLRGTPEQLLVVDVRPSAEYKSGHVAGAINIPYTKLEKRLTELRQARNGVVLYCTFGKRTRLAEQTLLVNDVPNVFHLEGGLAAWRQGGYEINTGWGP